MQSVLTTCPFCSCGCGLYLQCQAGAPVGVAPYGGHPVSEGRLCQRGWGAHEALLWGRRATAPLVRRGGTMVPASWDEALDRAAALLAAARDAGAGVEVVASPACTNEEAFVLAGLARRGLRSTRLDLGSGWAARPWNRGLARACGRAWGWGTFADVEKAAAILALEGDLARSHPRVALSVMRARRGGASLVTIGPGLTQIARLADCHVPSVPGSEGQLTEALAAALQAAGGGGAGADGRSDRPALDHAADLLRGRRVAVLVSPLPIPEPTAERAAAALAAVAGGSPGTGGTLLLLAPRCNSRGAVEMGVAPEPVEHASAGPSPAATLLLGEHPRTLLGRAETLRREGHGGVVALTAFLDGVAEMADVVLPVAAFAEMEGSVTNLEGRVQRVRAALPAPAGGRPGLDVLGELGERLGASFDERGGVEVRRAIAGSVPGYRRLDEPALDEGSVLVETVVAAAPSFPPNVAVAVSAPSSPFVLALDGVVDWGALPLIAFAPTLCRDASAERKAYPRGAVEIGRAAAERLGVRNGWPVRVRSELGEAVVTVVVRDGLEPSVALAPFALREHLAPVLGAAPVRGVTIDKA